jgi:hypothetical protein
MLPQTNISPPHLFCSTRATAFSATSHILHMRLRLESSPNAYLVNAVTPYLLAPFFKRTSCLELATNRERNQHICQPHIYLVQAVLEHAGEMGISAANQLTGDKESKTRSMNVVMQVCVRCSIVSESVLMNLFTFFLLFLVGLSYLAGFKRTPSIWPSFARFLGSYWVLTLSN